MATQLRCASEDEVGLPEPCAYAPCSKSRASSALVPFILIFVIALNYIPFVVWSLEWGRAPALTIALVSVFHLLLLFVVVSWGYTCATDPGVPPERWQRQMAVAAANGQEVRICRKSGLYKPARAHFCSSTQRLTLNMDHFCPWVVNTVGFYNRKFFILFLVYTCFALVFVVACITPRMPRFFEWLNDKGEEGYWLPGVINGVIVIVMLVVDCLLLLLLIPFLVVHMRMAIKNQTTIDGDRFPQYDVGAYNNLQQVFGQNHCLWWLPLYLHGPKGDGIHWPCRQEVKEDLPALATGPASPVQQEATEGRPEDTASASTSIVISQRS